MTAPLPARKPQSDIDIDTLERLAHNMDNLIPLPGTEIRVGLDAVLGFVPVVGDLLALTPSVYIYRQGHRAGVSSHTKGRMIFNIAMDTLIGSIPLVGDIFDIGFKSKVKNVALIREHLSSSASAEGRQPEHRRLPDEADPP